MVPEMKWLCILAAYLLIGAPAWGQGVPGQTWTDAVLNAPLASSPPGNSDIVPIIQGGVTKQLAYGLIVPSIPNVANAVGNLAALELTCTSSSGCPLGDPVFTGGLWRNTYGNGNGATPLFYAPSGSACSGANNGSQVTSADGKCWLASFPSTGIDPAQFGAMGNNSTDDTVPLQQALNAGSRIVLGPHVYCVTSGPIIWTTQGKTLIGAGEGNTELSACGADVQLVSVGPTGNAQYSYVGGMTLLGSQVVTTAKDTLDMINCTGCVVEDVFDAGGAAATFAGADMHIRNFTSVSKYGANYKILATQTIHFLRLKDDNQASTTLTGCTPPSCTIPNRISSHSYSLGNEFYQTQGGVSFLMQVTSAGSCSTAGSAPTIQPYNVNTTDGTCTTQLQVPALQFKLELQNAPQVHIEDSDFSGPGYRAIEINGSSNNTNIVGTVIGGDIDSEIHLDTGATGLQVLNSEFDLCVGNAGSCIDIVTDSSVRGAIQLTGNNQFFGGSYNFYSPSTNISLAMIGNSLSAEVLLDAGVGSTTIAHNNAPGITLACAAGSGDHINIVYNTGSPTVSCSASGAHVVTTPNQ